MLNIIKVEKIGEFEEEKISVEGFVKHVLDNAELLKKD